MKGIVKVHTDIQYSKKLKILYCWFHSVLDNNKYGCKNVCRCVVREYKSVNFNLRFIIRTTYMLVQQEKCIAQKVIDIWQTFQKQANELDFSFHML